jgi:hypothetical protein
MRGMCAGVRVCAGLCAVDLRNVKTAGKQRKFIVLVEKRQRYSFIGEVLCTKKTHSDTHNFLS